MKSVPLVFPLHSLRSRLLNRGFDLAYPLYRRFWKRRSITWSQKRITLLEFQTNTLGYAVGCFLREHQLELLDGYENHDVFHVLLGYDSTAVSETALQWHLFGNGKRSPFCWLAALSGALLFPEHWAYFRRAFWVGRFQRRFYCWQYEYLLREPLGGLQQLLKRNQ